MPMGGTELLVILIIILLLFGAKRVPELARSLGNGKHEFRRGIKEGEAEGEERDKAEAREREEKTLPSQQEDVRPGEQNTRTVRAEDRPESISGVLRTSPRPASQKSA
jgi:sec-independent protein translocase protein TatA